MNAKHQPATYTKEASCIEDVLAIANEVASGKNLAVVLNYGQQPIPKGKKDSSGKPDT